MERNLSYNQLGQDLDGGKQNEFFGQTVNISDDGLTIAGGTGMEMVMGRNRDWSVYIVGTQEQSMGTTWWSH